MALVPSNQFYPRSTAFMDSFQSSMSKLHITTRLHFLRYASSIPLKKQSFYVANSTSMNSDSIPQQYPQKSSNFDATTKNKRWDFASEASHLKSKTSGVRVSNNSWLGKWNQTHMQDKLKRPRAVLDYRNSGEASSSDCEENSGGSTMERIIQKLKKVGYVDDVSEKEENVERVIEKGSIEDIFYVEEGILPNARGGFSEKSPFGDQNVFASNGEVRFPWEKPELVKVGELNSVRQKSRTSFAELTLPESELRRLRNMALRIKNKTRISGGITHEVVEKIHEKWKESEVVRLKIEGTPALNMKLVHGILERKTGGLVIWRSGTSVALYRGVEYEAPSERLKKRTYNESEIPHEPSLTATSDSGKIPLECIPGGEVDNSQLESASTSLKKGNDEALSELNYDDEVDKLLDGLGPRFTDWPGDGPLPVDADLLPGVLPGYQPPFRILPYGVRSTLRMKEGTSLRRLARVLPPHFALGRSRQHQGLAAAMIKLWERSSIAKIALKRGVQLTTSERMAEDIKKLTGGVLLSRNKDFLVFYRGKNFLSPDVAEALLEKERLAKTLQDEEEQARLRASALVAPSMVLTDEYGTAGTLGETLDADARWGKKLDDNHEERVMREVEILRHANLVRKLQKKLDLAERKIAKAERALSKVEQFLNPVERSADPQSITDEERFMFRKLGLKMKALLLLGRRGVFDGTVENMHLHWKYRELIKIIVKAKTFEEVKNIALSLEAESGGVLVSVDKVSKGYAVIVFRGKDYRRPSSLRPKNLLTKRKALARSIELQRHQALLKHISALQTKVDQIRSEIGQMENVKEKGDAELYDRLDSSYLTEDENSEEEEDDVDTCSRDIDTSDECNDYINNPYSKTFSYDSGNVSETEYVE